MEHYHDKYVIETDFNHALDGLINTSKNDIKQVKARPFIKWVGGKNAISQKILEYLPQKIENYYEPFVGGGALFFNVRNRTKNVFLSDINGELILVYKIIRDKIDELVDVLKIHKKNHDKDYYYHIRNMHNIDNPIEMSARFIYLNKTCYNGLYRVNKNNEFNVPIGSYKNPTILDEDNLRVCSEELQGVHLDFYSFENIRVCKNSVVYCDPPYDKTYNQYTASKFERDMQEKLQDKGLEWSKKGAKVIISNADTEYVRNLYKGNVFNIVEIQAPRYVSCKNEGRNEVQELLLFV